MLTAPLLRKRTRPQTWARTDVLHGRLYTSKGDGRRPPKARSRTGAHDMAVERGTEVAEPGKGIRETVEPSLYEQLFPDQHGQEIKKQHGSEIPRLPIGTVVPKGSRLQALAAGKKDDDGVYRSRSSRVLKQKMTEQDAQTSVLVLRNASKNLVEEDFKRLIPQGKHLEGWKLEQGDILQVIPGRDLSTLAQQSYYYLLFSSPLNAFNYQGHASRIHHMVAAHSPSSILSPIPPPPGYMIHGMDAHAAIESFSLTSPTQSLNLRQLKPPLSPMMESIVRHGGYASLVKRKDRMPYEARLTLEGPQLHISAVRHILLASGRDRGLGWSGGDDLAPRLRKWEPLPQHEMPSLILKKPDAQGLTLGQERMAEAEGREHGDGTITHANQQQRRTAQNVYIAGFHTERAMQSFVYFWHRRPMAWDKGEQIGTEEGDLPPVANVEVLW